MFLAAGAAGIPLWKVLLLGGLSAALWNGVLLGAGAFLARNVEELVALVERYTSLAWVALGVGVITGTVIWLRRRRGARAAAGEQ